MKFILFTIAIFGYGVSSMDRYPNAFINYVLNGNTPKENRIPFDLITSISREWLKLPSPRSPMNVLLKRQALSNLLRRNACRSLVNDKIECVNDHFFAWTMGGQPFLTFTPSTNPQEYVITVEVRNSDKGFHINLVTEGNEDTQKQDIKIEDGTHEVVLIIKEDEVHLDGKQIKKLHAGKLIKVRLSWGDDIKVRDIVSVRI